MTELIIPKNYVEIPSNKPLIFLAWPISWAPDWQSEAIDIISSKTDRVSIASPEFDLRKDLVAKALIGDLDKNFSSQLDWERFYLKRAKQNWTVLFWLPWATNPDPSRPYSISTRRELWKFSILSAMTWSPKMVIWWEKDFPWLWIIARNIAADFEEYASDWIESKILPIKVRNKDWKQLFNAYDNLIETCEKAISLALSC